jgi:hypothetical protein
MNFGRGGAVVSVNALSQTKFIFHSDPQLNANVDAHAAWMHLQNLRARLQKQIAAHAVNIALAVGVASWIWLRGSLLRPTGLSGFAPQLSVLLVASALVETYFNFRRGAAALRTDWLAVAPISQAQRVAFLRATVALRSALSLLIYAGLAAGFSGARCAAVVLAFGSGLSILLLFALTSFPYHPRRHRLGCDNPGRGNLGRFNSGGVNPASHRPAHSRAQRFLAQRRTKRAPFSAWFHSVVPPMARLSGWWLVPLLALPMGSKLTIMVGVALGFFALLRFASVCQALSSALHQMTKLTLSTPLRPGFLYRTACAFSLHAGAALAVLCAVLAGLCAQLALVWVLFTAVFLALGTVLHFSFGFRQYAPGSTVRARAALVIATILAICIASAPPLLLISCTLLWPMLYRRGANP